LPKKFRCIIKYKPKKIDNGSGLSNNRHCQIIKAYKPEEQVMHKIILINHNSTILNLNFNVKEDPAASENLLLN